MTYFLSIFKLSVIGLLGAVSLMVSGCAQEADDLVVQDSDSFPDSDGTNDTDSSQMPAEIVFSEETMISYRITMDPDLYAEMEEYGNDEIYRPASVQITGGNVDVEYPMVGFRYKGAWTLHHCWDDNGGIRDYTDECAKLSTKIKFNEYDDGARFYGLKKINLHSLSADWTKLRDQLAYSVFNDFGVDAPRTAYAKLYINEEFIGLVLAVEQIDGRYAAFHYPDGGDGNLYKEIWPKPNMNKAWLLEQLRTNNNPEDNPDVSDMIAFGSVLANTSQGSFRTDVAPWVDVTDLLRYMAVDRAFRNWDGITAFYSPYTPHNFYWYHDDGPENRFHLIPWDLDTTMWEFDPFMAPEQWVTAPPLPDWNVKPKSCAPMPVWEESGDMKLTPPGCDTLINMMAATGWDEFVSIGNELLDTHMQYRQMEEKIDRWHSKIEDAVEADPHIDGDEWQQEVEAFKTILQDAILDFSLHLEEGYIIEN